MAAKKEELEQRVNQISEELFSKMSEMNARLKEYRQDKSKRKALRVEIKFLKKSIRHEWKGWLQLSQTIMSL